MGCNCKKNRARFKEMVKASIQSQPVITSAKTPRQIRIEARDVRCKARAERIRIRNEAILRQKEMEKKPSNI